MLSSESERRVGLTEIEGLEISTVFLAPVDTGLSLDGPVMFETLVFKEGTALNSTKYSTWAEAEIGHNLVVENIKAEFAAAGQLAASTLTKLRQR